MVATAVHAARLGLEVEAVRFGQPMTDHVAAMVAKATELGVRDTRAPSSTAMPFVLARRWAKLAPSGATLITPGGSTPVGVLGYVGAGLELADRFASEGWDEPDDVVVALGSGGSSVGLALGLAIAGWKHATVVAVRVADAIVTNRPVLSGIEAGVRGLLALGGGLAPAARWTIDPRWFGDGYGHPTRRGFGGGRAGGRVWGCTASRRTPPRHLPRRSSASTPVAAWCSCRRCRGDVPRSGAGLEGAETQERGCTLAAWHRYLLTTNRACPTPPGCPPRRPHVASG